MEFTVLKEDENIRIDKYLSSNLSDITRTKIQSLIKDGYVLVNDETVSSNYKIKEDDFIEVEIVENNKSLLEPEDIDIDILYEDDDLIVINKQKGLVVHPAPGNYTHTLVNALLYHFNELKEDEIRPGIVHRIDKDTTGCLIVCKNDKAFQDIALQIKNKTCHRFYLALVEGELEYDSGKIDAPISRNKKDRKKMAVVEDGKPSVTNFKVIERFYKYTLVEFKLETGRTHQIRVHMQYINHPIVGDLQYGYKNTRKDTNGQMLHAFKIEFIQPTTKEKIIIEAPLPEYFSNVLKELR